MKVVQASVLFILIFISATNGNDAKDAPFSGIVFEIMLTKLEDLQDNLEYLQEKMSTVESSMKRTEMMLSSDIKQQSVVLQAQWKKDRESFERKMSGDIGQLALRIDQKMEGIDRNINRQNLNVALLQTEVKKHHDFSDEKLETITGNINQLGQTMDHNFTAVLNQCKSAMNEPQHSVDEKVTGVYQHIYKANQETTVLTPNQDTAICTTVQSCKNALVKRSGMYLIKPFFNYAPFLGFCDQDTFGGGWLVFQYRYDGSVGFGRNWTEYRNGFGSLDEEFWLGLEHLYRLTSTRPHELLVELKEVNGAYKYARYDSFEIASESEHYALKNLGRHTGTAEDALTNHKGMKFSTKDRDNDRNTFYNLALMTSGAWWFKNAFYSNLNSVLNKSIMWNFEDPRVYHAYTRMSIRETKLINFPRG